MNTLVIVESPAKAVKIGEYLGRSYKVVASVGHIRDLPVRAEDFPAKLRDSLSPQALSTGIDVANNFKPIYVVPEEKKKTVARIRKLLGEVNEVILATDGDMEGEAIAWHLSQVLGLKNPRRMVFNEITKDALETALTQTRPLDLKRVAAQEARRTLDRLVGWEISPKLREMGYKLSAGRVQSAALASLAKREAAILNHVPAPYYRVTAQIAAEQPFPALVVGVGDKRLAGAKDFGPDGQLTEDVLALTETQAEQLKTHIAAQGVTLTERRVTPYTTTPPPPFTTSTLQQAASSVLGWSPQDTMSVAQTLYEAGKITYMRTDSVHLSEEAITAARLTATFLHGAASVPASARQYTSKDNAQEAHEAIRPAGSSFIPPYQVGLSGNELLLYTLIFQRTVASQMNALSGEKTSLLLTSGGVTLTASGRVVLDQGFTVSYADDSKPEDDQAVLPVAEIGQHWAATAQAERRHTPAPARFTEASLVKALEAAGVGRPSTFAGIISVLHDRGYTVKKKNQLHVSWLGLLVAAYLTREFPTLVNLKFTATMEEDLDRIAAGELSRVDYLKAFWSDDLEQTVAQAAPTPPLLAVPHFPGVSIGAQYRQVVMQQGGKAVPLPAAALPEETTASYIQRVMGGYEVMEHEPPRPKKRKRSASAPKKKSTKGGGQ